MGPSAKRAADKVAETLADHYPVVRNAFLSEAAAPFDAIVDDDAGLAQQRLFDEYPSLTIDPLNDGGMLPLSMLPPDGDYLGSAAKVAPPKSFVALFEAQFQALAKTHERSAFSDDEDRGIEKALAEAASQEPVPVDDVCR